METLRKIKENAILTAALSTVYGLVLFIKPETNRRLLGYVVGGALLVIGLMYIIQYIQKNVMEEFYKKELVYGLCSLILGVLVFVKVTIVTDLIPVVIGFFVLVSGVVKLQNAIDLLRLGYDKWKVVMILAGINVVLGAFLMMQPGFIARLLFRLLGLALMYSGISSFFTMHYFNKGTKAYKNAKTGEYEVFQKQHKRLGKKED